MTPNPAASFRQREAADVRSEWPHMTRRQRRAGARWWWRSCRRTEASWPEQWRSINDNHGVVSLVEDLPSR
jgi:hypothetical protein